MGLEGFTRVYRGLQGFSWVYRGLQGLRRGTPESRIFSGYYVVHANSSLTLQAITCLRFGLFCIFGGILWGGLKVFLRGLVKFMEIGNVEDLCCLKIRI